MAGQTFDQGTVNLHLIIISRVKIIQGTMAHAEIIHADTDSGFLQLLQLMFQVGAGIQGHLFCQLNGQIPALHMHFPQNINHLSCKAGVLQLQRQDINGKWNWMPSLLLRPFHVPAGHGDNG